MSFLRSVAILTSGTAVGHGLTFAALPFLSRLYSPSDFGILALYTGIVSILSVAVCLRFDVAVALPESDQQSLDILVLAISIAAVLSTVLAIVIFKLPSRLLEIVGVQKLADYLWLVPISAIAAGVGSSAQNWFLRTQRFSLISKTRAAQSTATVSSQAGIGLTLQNSSGLLLGQIAGSILSSAIFAVRLVTDVHARRLSFVRGFLSFKTTFKQYSHYPKYSTAEALLNSASTQIPIILISAAVAPAEAGYIVLAMYAMQAPMALVGSSVAQVYLSNATIENRAGRLSEYTTAVLQKLIKIGTGPILAIGILSPFLFDTIFGESWSRAGLIVAWMTPWFLIQFLASPVSMTLHVSENQRTAFVLQLSGVLIRVGLVTAMIAFEADFLAEGYALSGAIFYSLYLATVLRILNISWRTLWAITRPAAPATCFYILAAILIATAQEWILATTH